MVPDKLRKLVDVLVVLVLAEVADGQQVIYIEVGGWDREMMLRAIQATPLVAYLKKKHKNRAVRVVLYQEGAGVMLKRSTYLHHMSRSKQTQSSRQGRSDSQRRCTNIYAANVGRDFLGDPAP